MLFEKAIPYEYLPESDYKLKAFLNYNPHHNEYTRRQNIPVRSPDETDRGGWRGYDRVYTKYLSNLEYTTQNLLEVGIYHGYGLLAWSRYFQNAKIYGFDLVLDESQFLDINSIKNDFPNYYDRMNLIIADSRNQDDWLQFKEKKFDIIIDDGDHYPISQIKTLECGWKYLKPGGFYFIEDISHRYGEDALTQLEKKLKEFAKINYVSVYSHQNLGLRYLNNRAMMRRNKIVDTSNVTEYIVVIQKL